MIYIRLPRIRVHLFGYIFSPAWIPTFSTLLLLPFLISLGFWQLHRAEEKRNIEVKMAEPHKLLALNEVSGFTKKELQYQQLEVSGYFDNKRTFFLDNKIYQGHPGFHLVTPFIIPGEKKVLMIDRGFLTAENRNQLPTPPRMEGKRTLIGLIYFPTKTLVLKPELPSQKWPKLVQTLDLAIISKELNRATFPFCLLVQKGDELNLVQDWKLSAFPSYRHTGYAVQWFLLAFTLVIIYLILNTSRVNHE